MSKKKGKRNGGKFTMITEFMQNTEAWRDLTPAARAAYIEIKRRYNTSNNGSIGLGCRDLGQAINVGKDTANRALEALQTHGFIMVGKPSTFGQKRLVIEWRLTELKDDLSDAPASKEFAKWQSKKTNSSPSGETHSHSGETRDNSKQHANAS